MQSMLREIRKQSANCELVALVDMRACTVLSWSSAVKWSQNSLNEICNVVKPFYNGGVPIFEDVDAVFIKKEQAFYEITNFSTKCSEVIIKLSSPTLPQYQKFGKKIEISTKLTSGKNNQNSVEVCEGIGVGIRENLRISGVHGFLD